MGRHGPQLPGLAAARIEGLGVDGRPESPEQVSQPNVIFRPGAPTSPAQQAEAA